MSKGKTGRSIARKKLHPGAPMELRRRAEDRVREDQSRYETLKNGFGEPERMIHELQVHQVELEMQNEELARTRVELEKVVESYTDLYDSAPVGYFTFDRGGCIAAVNLTGADLLRVQRSALVNRPFTNFISTESRIVFKAFLERVFAGDREESCEVTLLREGLSPAIVQLVGNRARDDCRAAMINVTERRELEVQLAQAQKMESIGLFVGGVAHDFNNLLTAICGYGENIRENTPEDDKEAQDNISAVLHAAERAVDLTRSLLAFSRKDTIHPRTVHIDETIENTLKLIRKVIGEDITVDTSFSAKGTIVIADPGQISQVLMNLAANARDAMPGGGRISISTCELTVQAGSERKYDLAGPGRYVMISFSDTGTGISKATLTRIFEPFYTTKEVGKGTGLGLAVVYGIIKHHKGSIVVHSSPGKGTRFDIYLPVVEMPATTGAATRPTSGRGGDETVLIVEDEEMVRTFMQRILNRAGYKVVVAEDGEDAVTRFREHPDIAVVISDIVMPTKNGVELYAELASMRPSLKMIFTSGYAPETVEEKRGSEGLAFIKKPFHKNDFLAKIRQVLDKE